MKRLLSAAVALLALASCAPKSPSVMARYVPERMDDFIFENDLICGRIYGEALEGNPTSPGIDVWVKIPGALVADKRYKDELENGKTYHKNWGDGKDCYKVAVSLGAGASAPFIADTLRMPATNYRSWEILEQTPDKVVFVLHYPEWKAAGATISLDKKITVTAGTYFCRVDDTYTFTGPETITVAAGIFRHPEQNTIEKEFSESDRYAIWEHASDQSVEPEEGMLGVAVVVPDAVSTSIIENGKHGICTKSIQSGQTFTYWFGSCWTGGDIKTAEEWFRLVRGL
ncbi:MAG: DUF4861 family protein [Alistipes sp.]|nr:DUF4861 family protein [Candidatus Minthomonas equi]